MRDLYAVLGVSRDADQANIRKTYKKLAREFHPDVNPSETAADRFKEINSAYEVLGDESKRALYDRFGEASLRPGFDPARARAWGGAGGAGGPGGGFGGFGGMSPEDLFGSLFSGGMGGGFTGAPRPKRAERGPDLEMVIDLDMLDSVRGLRRPVSFRRPTSCEDCNGQGGTGRSTCSMCRGRGRVQMAQFGGRMAVPCSQCGGEGAQFQQECGRCAGTGRGMCEERLNVQIPPGVEDGKVIRLRGKGGDGRRKGPAGDLHIRVRVNSLSWLRREGDVLSMDLPISMHEAMAGGSVLVPTFAGPVRVKIPPGATNGQRMRLRGRGMELAKTKGAKEQERGDLVLVLRPIPPTSDDPEALEHAKALEAFYDGDIREHIQL